MITKLGNSPFILEEYKIDIPSDIAIEILNNEKKISVEPWLDNAANKIIEGKSGVVFSIGKLRYSVKKSRELSHNIVQLLHKKFLEKGLPENLVIEIDKPQETIVHKEHSIRTLLLHHDGGHCSYLTPSKNDLPDWDNKYRTFSNEGFTTTHKHKMYQGLFIVDPGEGLSVTTYYDWVNIIKKAYEFQTGNLTGTSQDIMRWLGQNIKRAYENIPLHHSRYLAITAALGCKELAYQGISIQRAEKNFQKEDFIKYPELSSITKDCPCHTCNTDILKFLCNGFDKTLGVTWPKFKEEFEVLVPTERYDFIIADNISMLHGGLLGGSQRVIEPICLVIDNDTKSQMYEDWLSKIWRKHEL